MQMRPSNSSSAGFIPISKDVYLRPGQRAVNDAGMTAMGPTVVLIFGWMSAQLPHLHKYTQYYSEVYPQAIQILLRVPPWFFFNTEKTNEAFLAPVVDELEAAGCIAPSKPNGSVGAEGPPRVLIHAFSNGGSSALVALGRLLSRRPTPSQRLTSIMVLDSCPATYSLSSALKAFTTSIPNRLVRIVVIIAIMLLHFYGALLHVLFNKPRRYHSLSLSQALLNPQVLPWVDEGSPRVYIFSKEDELVSWQDVAAHVEKAKELGMDARTQLYEGTRHVAHMRADPGRYWAAIGEAWGDACRAGKAEERVDSGFQYTEPN